MSISSAGARFGSVFPNIGQENIFSIGLHSALHHRTSPFRFVPFFDYAVGNVKKENHNSNIKIFSLGGSAVSVFELTYSKVSPYVGGGAGVSYISWDPGKDGTLEKEFDVTLNGVLGLEFGLIPQTTGKLELMYVLAGETDYLGAWLGFSYNL